MVCHLWMFANTNIYRIYVGNKIEMNVKQVLWNLSHLYKVEDNFYEKNVNTKFVEYMWEKNEWEQSNMEFVPFCSW